MQPTYAVLTNKTGRFTEAQQRARLLLDGPFDMVSRCLEEPPRPALHSERLSPAELGELSREADFVAAAEIMKIKLHAPVADDDDGIWPVGGQPRQRRQSWGITAVGADRSPFNGAGVTVALLDTGIDAKHPAFRGMHLVERDFTGTGIADTDGHGTHCAGSLFGRDVDGFRIGVANGITNALIGKVIGPAGGDTFMLARGLCWAHENDARIISISTGFDFRSSVADKIVEGWPEDLATAATLHAYRANLKLFDNLLHMLRLQESMNGGAVLIAAAGNDSRRGPEGSRVIPASLMTDGDGVVSVASIDPDPAGSGYRISSFSNCGVSISAPGRRIVSAALGGGLETLSGTSMACPHVAGVAALWWEAVRSLGLPASAPVVRARLLGSAQHLGFAADVSPAERGAGGVRAPLDGTSLHQATGRSRVAEFKLAGDIAWARQGRSALTSAAVTRRQ